MDDVFDAQYEVSEERIGDIRNHNTDRMGPTASQAARDAVRAVVKSADRFLNAKSWSRLTQSESR